MKARRSALLVLVALAVLLGPLAAQARELPSPPPPPVLDPVGDDAPGVKKLQADRTFPHEPPEPPIVLHQDGTLEGGPALLDPHGNPIAAFFAVRLGGKSPQTAAIEKKLRRLAEELR
jgi:hypothetical protein